MKTRLSFIIIALFCLGLSKMQAQCTASFTYTTGSNGYVSFTSTSVGTNTSTKYTWHMGNGVRLNNVSDTAGYAYCFNGTYTVSLVIADSAYMGGCWDSTAQVINISNSPNTKCLPANFTYTVSGGTFSGTLTNATSYNVWDFGDYSNYFTNTAYNTSSPTHNYTHNGTYTVTCYTQYQYGSYGIMIPCDTFSQVVNVTSVPCVASFVADSNNTANKLYLYNTAQGDTAVYYSANGGPWIQGPAYPAVLDSFMNLPAGNNTICQKIYGVGCTDSLCKTVFVNCTISETHTVGCGQVSVTTTANPSLSSAAWYIAGSQVSTQINPVITFTNITSFYLTYTLQNSLCTKTDSIYIQVGPTPVFYVHPDSISGPHNWLVYVDNQPNYTTYHWNWGDGTSSYSAFPTHTYTTAAWYNICLTITDNCGDSATVCQNDSLYRTSSTMIGVTVTPLNAAGISSYNSAAIRVYPVPASDNLVIENLSKASHAELYDNEERKVLSEMVSEKQAQISVKDLAPGFYLMKIYSGNEVWLKKIIKQ